MDTVLHIQGDEESALTPLILIHAISGLSLPYLALESISADVEDLSDGRPVYGISSPIYNSPTYRPPHDISKLAAEYVEIVRQEIQSNGPYILGGWSLGGMIAVEMAAILQSSGEEVQKIIMVDSMNPRCFLPFRDTIEHETVTTLSYNTIAKRMHAPTVPLPKDTLTDSVSDTSSESRSDSDVESDYEETDGFDEKQMVDQVRVHIRETLRMLSNKPRQISEKVDLPNTSLTLIKCGVMSNLSHALREPRRQFARRLFNDPLLGWSPGSFRSFKVIRYGANHDGCFDPAHVGNLSAIIRDALEEF